MKSVNFLSWFPRIIILLYAGFISIFALDSFEGHHSFWSMVWHFIAHLMPTFVVLGVLVLAWRYRIFGGLVFMVLGMIFTIYYGTWRSTELFLMFSVPLFLGGLGFIFSRYGEI